VEDDKLLLWPREGGSEATWNASRVCERFGEKKGAQMRAGESEREERHLNVWSLSAQEYNKGLSEIGHVTALFQ
jgi:hypothetical protein